MPSFSLWLFFITSMTVLAHLFVSFGLLSKLFTVYHFIMTTSFQCSLVLKARSGSSYNRALAVALKSTKAVTLGVSVVLFALTALLLLSAESKKIQDFSIKHSGDKFCMCTCVFAYVHMCTHVSEISSSDDIIHTSTVNDTESCVININRNYLKLMKSDASLPRHLGVTQP